MNKPLQEILRKRNITLRDLYFKIDKKISLPRLSDIKVARECITKNEIEILNKYLRLNEEEIEQLEDMELDKILIENTKWINDLSNLVPKDLKAGQSVIKKCPKCGNNLRISRASINGHLWIVCEKEGVLLCE